MILFKEAEAVRKKIRLIKQEGKKIGLVPTMGALHKGHISLIEQSKKVCGLTVSSIFVNPTQFNDLEDFKKYPATLENDIFLLENAGCDILFFPSTEEIYPDGTDTKDHYDVGEIEFVLEGKYRPGHFQGVCQVVHKLLNIIQPDDLFMGQKDYQQCLIVKRLIQLIDMPVKVVTVDTYREATGLAMSSRNLRLSDEQKRDAAAISKMLYYIKANFSATPLPSLLTYARNYLLSHGFKKIDYIAIVDDKTLLPLSDVTQAQGIICLIAACTGEVRLIDNLVISE